MGAKPPPSAFTPAERALLSRLRRPADLQRWLESMVYNREKTGPSIRSFRGVVRDGTAHCLEAAIAAAVVIEQWGDPPLVMNLDSKDRLGHAATLFQRNGRWGAIARSKYPGLQGRKAVFRSVRDLAWSYFDPFVDYTGEVIGFAVVDLAKEVRGDWRLASHNVWRVEHALLDAPHKRMKGASERVGRLRAFYRAFKAQHPELEPPRYPGHERWL
ncbi:MAG: hypothetical protein ACYDDF_10590 [Thermoplasmatota archaeon]